MSRRSIGAADLGMLISFFLEGFEEEFVFLSKREDIFLLIL